MIIAVVRIKGQINLRKPIVETLNRLRVRKKYACVVFIKPTKIQEGMIKKVADFVAFGEIDEKMLKEIIEKRGKVANKKKPTFKSDEIIDGLKKGKKLSDFNLKPFFRLHPPRKGIESKKHFGVGKGVLGNHKNQINKLIERML